MGSRKLKLGDIVFCQRSNFFFGDVYQHYGVYAGYHKIIHYIKGDSPLDGRIAETSIEESFVMEIPYILLKMIVYYLFSKTLM